MSRDLANAKTGYGARLDVYLAAFLTAAEQAFDYKAGRVSSKGRLLATPFM